MATAEEEEKERAVFDDDDDDDDDSEEEEEEEEEDDDDDEDTDADLPAAAEAEAEAEAAPPPPSTMEADPPTDSTADAAARNPNPNPNPNPSGGVVVAAAAEEARRLFQRLWTEEEELVILRGFAEFTTRRGTAFASHQYDTGPFYEEMRRLLPLDFSKSQLVEKLRRLKKKYLTCVSRLRSAPDSFAFRSPHEQALFQISRNIWTPSSHRPPDPDPDSNSNNSDSDRKPPPPPPPPPSRQRQRRRRLRRATLAAAAAEDPIAAAVSVPITVTAENQNLTTPKQPPDLLPLLFKELVGAAIRGPLLGFGVGSVSVGDVSVDNLGDGRWRTQQILELEVYLKRLELLREHIESTLRDLKGSSGGA